jgi:hypothetical protein
VRLPSLRIKIFGAITTVLLLLLGCALTVPLASAEVPEVTESSCGAAMSSAQLNLLLDLYAQAYSTKQSYWQIADKISDGLFCLGKSPEYVSDLKILEARATGVDADPYLALSEALQNDWETKYLLKVTIGRRNRETLAAEGSNSLILVTLTLGFFNIPNQITNYFGLFRQLIPVTIPGAATFTAKALNTRGLLDDAYPLAPAHVMTNIKIAQHSSSVNTYEVLRTVTGATASVAGAEAATEFITFCSVGAVTLGSFTFNPLTIAASLAISQAAKYAGTKAVDEYEFIALKNDLAREEEGIIASIANNDLKQAHSLADDFYKTIVEMASALDLKEIDAYNSYQKGVNEANAKHHIPLIDETSAAHAKTVYDKKDAKIEAARDPKAVDASQLFTVLSLIGDSPTQVASLSPELSAKADAILDLYEGYRNTHGYAFGDHYPEFIQSQIDAQDQQLAQNLHDGNIIKDSQYLLLEAVAFLKQQNAPVLNGSKNQLLHLLQTGLVLQMQ